MDEETFDSLILSQPFGTADAMRADARLRRCTMLGIALWGKTLDDLHRQLLAPSPEIPPGFELADFRALLLSAQEISALSSDPRFAPFSHLAFSSQTLSIGGQRFTAWEARCEIARRVIQHLERR